MNNITPIIEAEAKKYINEFLFGGFTYEESIRKALDKVKSIKRDSPLVVIFWEIEKALIIKLNELKEKK